MELAKTIKRAVSIVVCLAMVMGLTFAASDTTASAADNGEQSVIELKVREEITGTMISYYNVEKASFVFELSGFFDDNTVYNKEIASASMQFSNAIYENSGFAYDTNEGTKEITEINDMLEYHGFNNPTTYLLGTDDGSNCGKIALNYADDAISEFAIAYKDVTLGGTTKRIFAVVVRGSNGTIEEWSNNFDIGDRENKDKDNEDWGNKDIHKGFYFTEKRILKQVEEYVSACQESNSSDFDTVFWLTGHSRGAALSNLLAKDIIDASIDGTEDSIFTGSKVFAYTFAAPATTVAADRCNEKYDSIFNIVNTSDVVPALPFAQWGFGRYGKTIEFSIEDSGLAAKWCEATGRSAYNPVNKSFIELATNRITKTCAKTWEDAFKVSDPQLISKKQFNSLTSRELKYVGIKENKLGKISLGYTMKPSTVFVFQLAAVLISGDERCTNGTEGVMQVSAAKNMLTELWNSKFSSVLILMCGDALGDIPKLIKNWPSKFDESLFGDGHAPATYYVIASNYMG